MDARRLHTDLLVHAGRLLLEYNESTRAIHQALTTTAAALTDETCQVVISYGRVAVSLGGDGPLMMPVPELRFNNAVLARVHTILRDVRQGKVTPATARELLKSVEGDTPRQSRWLTIVVFGAAAASLAALLGGDAGAVSTVGLSSALGLLIRQELGRLNFTLLTLPLTAALVGAGLGGLVIRLGWTQTWDLVLIVPALMLVPGPHLINGIMDLIDNYLPMCTFRLVLATGILCASALGIVLGIELTLPDTRILEQASSAPHLNLVSDMVLAGIVTCGFALFYNTALPLIGLAAVGGMAGHGLRFLALQADYRLETATFLGSIAVGVVSAWMSRSCRAPVAVIAFAGAVTMMPGLSIYRALGGALKLARLTNEADPALVALTLGNAAQSCFVVCGLALGLIIGARTVMRLVSRSELPGKTNAADNPDNPTATPIHTAVEEIQ